MLIILIIALLLLLVGRKWGALVSIDVAHLAYVLGSAFFSEYVCLLSSAFLEQRRSVILCMVRKYAADPKAFQNYLDVFAREFKDLIYNGFEYEGVRYHVALFGMKGDCPLVAKASLNFP